MNKKGLMFLAVAPLMAYALMSFNEPVTLEARDADLLIELKDENYSVKEREEIQKEFIHELNTVLDFNYRVVGTYSYANNVINIKLPSSKIELVKSMSLVEKANLNAFHKADSFISDSFTQIYHPLFNSGDSKTVPSENYSAKQMNVPTSNKGGQGTFLAILDSSFLLTHEGFTALSGNVRYSEADMKTKVSTSGFYGAPDATHSTYYNSKVPFYYDYGGDSVVSETVPPTPDYDVFTKLSDHGQHVSTLCAGNGSYKGIAPNAQLALMKVFTTYTVKDQSSVGALDSAILNALNDCAIIGVDGINLSLGNFITEYSADDVIVSTMKKLNDAGTNINISAGNEGKGNFSSLAVYSNFTTGNVETGVSGGFATMGNTNVIASGNLTDDEGLSSSLTVGDTFISYHDQVVNHTGKDADGNDSTTTFTKQLPFSSLLGTAESKEFDFVNVPNYGQEADYASIDVKGKIAVVSRGTSTFVDKVTQASKHGAIGFILYNSADQGDLGWMVLDGVAESDLIPVASCDNLYKNTFLDSKTLKVKISKDYASDYSSEGGSSKLEINVDITTPGQNVYGGLTASDTDYGYMSGTSMAAPNYTGALAVILGESDLTGENRTNYSKKLAMITQSTSNQIVQGNGAYYSPRKVGAGYIDVTKAIKSGVYLEGTSANETKVELLNGDEVKKGELKFSVKTHNTSTSTKAYKGTLYVEAPLTTTLDKVSLPQFNGATVKTQYDKLLESYSFDVNVPAGDSSFDVDHVISEASKTYLDSNFENGTYLEGYVVLDGDVDLSIPYLGFYGDYSKEFAVEPYNFEKEDGKVYGSDLLNYLCKNTTLGVTAAFAKKFNVSCNYIRLSSGEIEKKIAKVNEDFINSTKITKAEAKREALEVMKEVGIPLPERRFKQYPFEFSGGMRQRIVIAIALTANPEILICDEPTTALDVTIQAQILELINKLKRERNLSCIFITHDLGVVANMADRVAVMYSGKIVEYGLANEVFFDPRHPYTWALLSSIPDVDSKEKLEAIPGTPPDMIYPPKGDAFALRSKYAMTIDFKYEPPFFKVSDTHYAATWLLYPGAPKVEMPRIVKTRIDNALKAEKERVASLNKKEESNHEEK